MNKGNTAVAAADDAQDVSVRQQVKDSTQEEFAKARTKAVLADMAETAGVDAEKIAAAKTKADLVALIYGKFPLPDPALRGKSEIDDPVLEVWLLAHAMWAKAKAEGTKPRRKDVIAAGEALGIAFYTVRTQYQAWFSFTNKGESMITAKSEGKTLPKGMLAKLFPEKK